MNGAPDLLLAVKWELILISPWMEPAQDGSEGEERCSCMEPTQQTFQRKDAAWLSVVPSQSPSGTSWPGENGVAVATLYVLPHSGELKASVASVSSP